jgi:hypothetical protein
MNPIIIRFKPSSPPLHHLIYLDASCLDPSINHTVYATSTILIEFQGAAKNDDAKAVVAR